MGAALIGLADVVIGVLGTLAVTLVTTKAKRVSEPGDSCRSRD